MLLGLPVVLQGLISSYLWPTNPPNEASISPLTFQLRHQHGASSSARILFSDIQRDSAFSGVETEFTIHAVKGKTSKPSSLDAFTAPRRSRIMGQTPMVTWNEIEVPVPDVTKRSSLLQLAKMAGNAYAADVNSSGWYDISDEWNSNPHGWLPDDDGLRGHVFVTPDNSSVVISIKGTSATWPVGEGGPTKTRDKLNDNMLFSCCCARVGPTWSPVCGCYSGGYRCDENCVEEALKDDGLFYPIGLVEYLTIDMRNQADLRNRTSTTM